MFERVVADCSRDDVKIGNVSEMSVKKVKKREWRHGLDDCSDATTIHFCRAYIGVLYYLLWIDDFSHIGSLGVSCDSAALSKPNAYSAVLRNNMNPIIGELKIACFSTNHI